MNEVGVPSDRHFSRVGGAAALIGVVVLAVSTALHPMSAPPDDPLAAFAEYAADGGWVASHLGQLLGNVLIGVGLLALSWRLREGRAGVWAALGAAGAVVCVALSGALQAVDGIALKVMVDRWAEAPPDQRALRFEGAYAVRQVEMGLAAVTILFFAVTAASYAVASWLGRGVPRWTAAVAGAAAIGMVVGGTLYAYTGFSERAMDAVMVSTLLLAVWIVAAGVVLLRSARSAPPRDPPSGSSGRPRPSREPSAGSVPVGSVVE